MEADRRSACDRPHGRTPARPACRVPIGAPGLRIGLLGGSFNPPHAAHRAISVFAMKRLGLDWVWWLVTPGNPLKSTQGLRPLADRIAAARAAADHPRIKVTDLEAAIGTRYSYDTVKTLTRRSPATRFVWIMGADNLAIFHRWRNWRGIARLLPIAVVDRVGTNFAGGAAIAAQAMARSRLPEAAAMRLASHPAPAWVFLHGLKSPLSSTALRRHRDVGRRG
jgi:nicotinate-nucleotide adenylyltransferase